jgi:hypothetical protein
MLTIDWTSFSWQAFATMLTGLMAVAAASFVAIRQLAIARRQAELTARQTELSALTIREKLFDRRFAIYKSVREYVGIVSATGELDKANYLKFYDAVEMSRFLFSKRVHERLTEIRKVVDKLEVSRLNGNHKEMVVARHMLDQERNHLTDLFLNFLKLALPRYKEDTD